MYERRDANFCVATMCVVGDVRVGTGKWIRSNSYHLLHVTESYYLASISSLI